MFDWTEARIERLKELWNARTHTCSEIAAGLGHGVTRNAVIGKVTRLGLESHGVNSAFRTPKPKRQRAPRTIRKNGTGYVPHIVNDEPDHAPDLKSLDEIEAQPTPATFLGIALLKLNETHCRYPREIDGVFLFCGQVKLEGSSYCRECHRRCHSGFHVRRAA